MEELLACVYLIEEGLESETLYDNKLNELFAATPYCNDLFKLELLSGNIKESIVYIKTHIDYSAMNKQIFGKTLMTLLKPIYASMDIEKFGCHMFSLWESLAGNLQDEEPFSILSYADNSEITNDRAKLKNSYEKMLLFYD